MYTKRRASECAVSDSRLLRRPPHRLSLTGPPTVLACGGRDRRLGEGVCHPDAFPEGDGVVVKRRTAGNKGRPRSRATLSERILQRSRNDDVATETRSAVFSVEAPPLLS
ncbi:hypothetical protein MRX96_011367 [Rhipicephalus microplus]